MGIGNNRRTENPTIGIIRRNKASEQALIALANANERRKARMRQGKRKPKAKGNRQSESKTVSLSPMGFQGKGNLVGDRETKSLSEKAKAKGEREMAGICEMARMVREIEELWNSVGVKDATAHDLFMEFELKQEILHNFLCNFVIEVEGVR